MKSHALYSLAIATGLLLAGCKSDVVPAVYSSAAGDYAVTFPAPPEEEVNTAPNFRAVSHVLKADQVIYIVIHGDFTEPILAEAELNGNIENYVKEIRGMRLASRAPLVIARGDKAMPAKQFAYEGERGNGKGIVVVDGKTSYLAAATAVRGYEREAAMNAFIASFKLLPPNQ